jgi:hypothetical protein
MLLTPVTRQITKSDRASVGNVFIRMQHLVRTGCFAALLSVAGPAAMAQTVGKIPRDVIEEAAAHGTVLVLVGLKVPWQMESILSEDLIRTQREAINAAQGNLLIELSGTKHKITRRYEQVPGIALEVGADALAALARSATVVNVLLDRPVVNATNEGIRAPGQRGAPAGSAESKAEKVPWQLFKRVANDGTILVLAGLRTPWQREDSLSEELLALQRAAILNAQSYLLAELAGTQFNVMRLYQKIPGIALRVGLDALKVLERSSAVTNVLPDRPAKPSP